MVYEQTMKFKYFVKVVIFFVVGGKFKYLSTALDDKE